MSDSEDDSPVGNLPADSEIDQCLRRVVRDASKNDEEITIKTARARVEKELGLEDDFFKTDAKWKARSKDAIYAAFDEPPSPQAVKKSAPATKPKTTAGAKRKSETEQPASKKKLRKSPVADSEGDLSASQNEGAGAKKKPTGRRGQKKQHSPVVDSEREDSDASGAGNSRAGGKAPSPRMSKATKKAVSKSEDDSPLTDPEEQSDDKAKKPDQDNDSDLSSVIDDAPPKKKRQPTKPTKPASKPAEDDESDLSSVIDDGPPPKKRRQTKNSTSPKPTKSKSTKTNKRDPRPKAPSKDLTPDEGEIRRLQSNLLKCGVRKLWHRELANCTTPKDKIRHLRGMLEDVGMTGRFSAQKAEQIKESRELRAELESAQAFEKQWGDKEEGSGSGNEGAEGAAKGAGRRLKPKGLVDLGDSGEGSD